MSAIQSIIVRPEKRGEPLHIQEVYIRIGGIVGDHYAKPEGHRQVTLVAADALSTVADTVGFQGDAHVACRRNICVDSFPDGDLIGKQIAIGNDALMEVTCYCYPCNRMNENFGEGAVEAFAKKAGWGAKIIREGKIKVGDPFQIL
ncbi:MAG TPA: MOSC domain-containing protein [Saprospiraceae bacterium]|jgi:MOSC domain-containing protein YiiM